MSVAGVVPALCVRVSAMSLLLGTVNLKSGCSGVFQCIRLAHNCVKIGQLVHKTTRGIHTQAQMVTS